MSKWLISSCFALVVLHVPNQASAQFSDPRTYDNTPVGINQVELSYTYVHANASIDTSLIITGANFNLNQGIIDYTRYFGFFHRLTWVEASVPVAGLGGSISGTNIHRSRGLQLRVRYVAEGTPGAQLYTVRKLRANYHFGCERY
ncbi:MAG TPA: hypothetical protein VN843_10510, partial [Anaerolineales bacterium]|nr:hypothetical protein [Anaerolineales bacterium]